MHLLAVVEIFESDSLLLSFGEIYELRLGELPHVMLRVPLEFTASVAEHLEHLSKSLVVLRVWVYCFNGSGASLTGLSHEAIHQGKRVALVSRPVRRGQCRPSEVSLVVLFIKLV